MQRKKPYAHGAKINEPDQIQVVEMEADNKHAQWYKM